MDATLFAILYDLLFAVAVVAAILGLCRTRIKTWVFCIGALLGSALLWLLMFAIFEFLIGWRWNCSVCTDTRLCFTHP